MVCDVLKLFLSHIDSKLPVLDHYLMLNGAIIKTAALLLKLKSNLETKLRWWIFKVVIQLLLSLKPLNPVLT